MGTSNIGFSQESSLEPDGGTTSCSSTDKNNAYCNKYASASGGLPNYYCETTSCHGTTCFDCVK